MTKRQDKYWICGACAKDQGLIFPKYPVTCTKGICGHCENPKEVTLIPVCDFSDPKTGRKSIWD